jgi:hypothetical protein
MPDDRRVFEQELAAMMNDRAGSEQERGRSQTLHRTQIDTRMTRLTDAYVESAIDATEFRRRKTALELERRQLDEPFGGTGEEFTPADVHFYLELAQRPSLLYKLASHDEKRDLVKILTSNRGVRARTPRFQLAVPFADLMSSSENQTGDPSRGTARTRGQIRALIHKWMRLLKRTDEKEEQERKDRLSRLHDLMDRSEFDRPNPVYVPINNKPSEDDGLPVIRAA